MSWIVSYLSGLGRLMSLRYSTRRSASRGRSTRCATPPVLWGALQHCASFWITLAAVVCAEHTRVATEVERRRAKQSSSTIALPHPSGPTSTNGCPDSSQGMMSDCTCATASVMTRPRHLPSTTPAGSAASRSRSAEEALTYSRSPSPVRRCISATKSSRAMGSMLAPNPRATPRANACLLSAPTRWLSAFLMVPTLVVSVAVGRSIAQFSALKK
mmetsp:Transcript_30418/g.76146  ORF Transcript_30418/g.76146 Transcript_30418/m.76146 type:complete len:215 (-) Transcript_30418:780-1424(-)